MAPVVASLGNPLILRRLVLLAINRPPPIVVNDGHEMLVKERSAMKAKSPLTEVRFGAIIESMDEL